MKLKTLFLFACLTGCGSPILNQSDVVSTDAQCTVSVSRGSASFDGVNDQILISGTRELAPTSITISLWVRLRSLEQQFFFDRHNGSHGGLGNQLLFSGQVDTSSCSANQFQARLQVSPCNGVDCVDSINFIDLCGRFDHSIEWNHLLVSYDANSGLAAFYVNDSLQDMVFRGNGLVNIDPAQPIAIGAQIADGTIYMSGKTNGNIADVVILDHAATSSEQSELNLGTVNRCNGVLANWRLNDGSGLIARGTGTAAQSGMMARNSWSSLSPF